MNKGRRNYLSIIMLMFSIDFNLAMALPEEDAFRGIFHSVYLAASKGTYKVFSEQKDQLVTKQFLVENDLDGKRGQNPIFTAPGHTYLDYFFSDEGYRILDVQIAGGGDPPNPAFFVMHRVKRGRDQFLIGFGTASTEDLNLMIPITQSSAAKTPIHWGINSIFRPLRTRVEKAINGALLNNTSEFDVQVVGHSLGGSLSIFLGLHLESRFPGAKISAFASGPVKIGTEFFMGTLEGRARLNIQVIYNEKDHYQTFLSRLAPYGPEMTTTIPDGILEEGAVHPNHSFYPHYYPRSESIDPSVKKDIVLKFFNCSH